MIHEAFIVISVLSDGHVARHQVQFESITHCVAAAKNILDKLDYVDRLVCVAPSGTCAEIVRGEDEDPMICFPEEQWSS